MASPRKAVGLTFAGFLFAVSIGLASLPITAQVKAIAAQMEPGGAPIATYSHPIPLYPDDPDNVSAGDLTYLGGIVITSPDKRFGGYSGLLVDPSGKKFLAQSDRAYWFTGDIDYTDGHVSGVSDTVLAPMLNAQGKQLTGRPADSESIAETNGFPGEAGSGDILVGFETVDRVDRYPLGRDGFLARPHPVRMPADIKHNVPNKGLEGIHVLPDGRLLAITEQTLDANGNEKGWLVALPGSHGPTGPLTLKRDAPYDCTDLALAPNGDIYTLERRFSPISGIGMQIRHIAKDTIKPGAVLDGPVIARLGPSSSIDNMEGLSIRQGPDGELLFYLISDDNQSSLQHTVLLEFRLNAE
jgi:hypothetical protein